MLALGWAASVFCFRSFYQASLGFPPAWQLDSRTERSKRTNLGMQVLAKRLLGIVLVNVLLANESHTTKPRADVGRDDVRAQVREAWLIRGCACNSLKKKKKTCLKCHVH